jgi:hypothetical protein
MTRSLFFALTISACGGPMASTTPAPVTDAGTPTSDANAESTPAPKATCRSGGKEYADGERWPCPDHCNTCTCRDGRIASTLQMCETRIVDAGLDAR